MKYDLFLQKLQQDVDPQRMTITHWRIEFPPLTKNPHKTNVNIELQILAMMFFHINLLRLKPLWFKKKIRRLRQMEVEKKKKKRTMKRQGPGFNRTLSLLQYSKILPKILSRIDKKSFQNFNAREDTNIIYISLPDGVNTQDKGRITNIEECLPFKDSDQCSLKKILSLMRVPSSQWLVTTSDQRVTEVF